MELGFLLHHAASTPVGVSIKSKNSVRGTIKMNEVVFHFVFYVSGCGSVYISFLRPASQRGMHFRIQQGVPPGEVLREVCGYVNSDKTQ